MKALFSTVTLASALLLASCSNAQQQNMPANADVATFEQLVSETPGQLVDVRTPEEYAQGHLDGSANMDFYASDFEEQLSTLDPEKPVYVYCRSGGRSSKAATMLRNKGFKEVVNLQGGILAWESQQRPVEK